MHAEDKIKKDKTFVQPLTSKRVNLKLTKPSTPSLNRGNISYSTNRTITSNKSTFTNRRATLSSAKSSQDTVAP